MIRIFKVGFIFIMSLMIFSCNKTDGVADVYIVPYAEQYPVDIAAIDKYLDEYHMEVSVDGNKDVTFTKLTQAPVGSLSIRAQYASNLHTKIVTSNGVDYKVYYINITDILNPNYYGSGENPTSVDSVFVSYRGEFLYTKKEAVVPATNPITYNSFIASTKFDEAQNPVWFPLYNVIEGWKEIFPLFKTGDPGVPNATNGTVSYANFGAGVMFLPSGLAYYSGGVGSIPSYSPLIFSFKLKGLNYVDHDRDGIDSKNEDINGNGIFTDDDTDGDGRPNYLDIDDDGDGYSTKSEIRKPTNEVGVVGLVNFGPSKHYPYDSFVVVDDPATLSIDESLNSEPRGIPAFAASGEPDYTSAGRLRIHLDKSHHTAKP
jgi:hypothetical protein